jgi:nucleoside-diphosphate-sugar epimerase
MKILVMGGTRFVGKPLVDHWLQAGHQLTLFTRGKNPVPTGVQHLVGDRTTADGLDQLSGCSFDVIADTSGRNLVDSKAVL